MPSVRRKVNCSKSCAIPATQRGTGPTSSNYAAGVIGPLCWAFSCCPVSILDTAPPLAPPSPSAARMAVMSFPILSGSMPVRFVIMTNELPNMRDASGALTTRVILLRLTRHFRGREDRTLTDRLTRELPGILNWSISGWHRLRERGEFLQPESGQELLDDLQDLASPIGAFTRDCCIIGPEFEARIDDLFSGWRKWCEAHGRDRTGTRETFAKDLRAAFAQIQKRRPRCGDLASDRRETTYMGIGLR